MKQLYDNMIRSSKNLLCWQVVWTNVFVSGKKCVISISIWWTRKPLRCPNLYIWCPLYSFCPWLSNIPLQARNPKSMAVSPLLYFSNPKYRLWNCKLFKGLIKKHNCGLCLSLYQHHHIRVLIEQERQKKKNCFIAVVLFLFVCCFRYLLPVHSWPAPRGYRCSGSWCYNAVSAQSFR